MTQISQRTDELISSTNALSAILPIGMVSVTFQFLTNVQLPPFHQPALSAFLRTLLSSIDPHANSEMERYWTIDTPEAPKINYQKGDYYRFTIICFDGGVPLLEALLIQLCDIKNSPARFDSKMPFRQNIKVVSIQDLISLKDLQNISTLQLYDERSLREEVAQWIQFDEPQHLLLRWLSPVRLKKDAALLQNKDLKGEQRYCRNQEDLPASLFLKRLYHSVRGVVEKQNPEIPYSPSFDTQCIDIDKHLFWFDFEYTNKEKIKNAMGGMSGEMRFKGFDPAWLPWLVLGQYIGIGQRRSFGWGRYQLFNHKGETSFKRVFPAQPLLAPLLNPQNLLQAFDHVKKSIHSIDEKKHISTLNPLNKLLPMAEKLIANAYRPPPLHPVTLEQTGKKTGELAVPPFWDRVLQRAVHELLSPILEQLYYPKSYGYRMGRSRIDAKDKIHALIQEGYHWVLESDIEDFFNNISRPRLITRLKCILQYPLLIDLLTQWMDAPLLVNKKLKNRPKGIALGSPLSPMFANLLLDDFDNDMKFQKFQLIRYADDFLVLCKTEKEAEEALAAAKKSLNEHGLTLNLNKTKITHIDRGVRFLGYLFMNDLVLDVGSEITTDHLHQLTPKTSSSELKPKIKEPELPEVKEPEPLKIIETDQSVYIGTGRTQPERLQLCISGEFCLLNTEHDQLLVSRNKKVVQVIPWRHLHTIIVLGNHNLTSPVLRKAMQSDIPIYFINRMGVYQGCLSSNIAPETGVNFWLLQQERFQKPEHQLTLSKQLMVAKITHCHELLRGRQLDPSHLNQMLKNLNEANNLATLNGLEGQAAKAYFEQLAGIIPGWCQFSKRNRRPPKDPFNLLLSLGYTMIYNYCHSFCQMDGLLPWQGFYHVTRSGHAALASDLMEPFRYLVDRVAIDLLLNAQLTEQHFSYPSLDHCQINATGSRLYTKALIETFQRKIKAIHQKHPLTLFEQIHAQNLSLIRWVKNDEPFQPWRTR